MVVKSCRRGFEDASSRERRVVVEVEVVLMRGLSITYTIRAT